MPINATKKRNCRRKLMKGLDSSYKKILFGHDYLDKEVRNKNEVIQAAEWLLDNLYLIQKEYKDIKSNMPEDYYKNLPIVENGIMRGYPRVYNIAVEIVSNTDGRIDEETIKTFISTYQNNTILTSGELWALPIMIRIALIQNISKVSEMIVLSQWKRKKDHLAIEKITAIEHEKEISYQSSIGNSITSIREIASINWKESFEELSYVENVLRKDPSRVYENMDFESRNYYRHSIEKLSKYIGIPEYVIAKKAIECAEQALDNKDSKEYETHVGYYIVDKGIEYLKQKIGNRETRVRRIITSLLKENVNVYIGIILIATIILTGIIICVSFYDDENPMLWKYLIAALAILIPCSEIIISTFNWYITRLIHPRFIPKVEFSKGIPKEFSAMVVIPSLLNNESNVENLMNDIEIYYLSNREENLYFALLGDFKDSDEEYEEEDNKIVDAALKLVKELNKKYSSGGKDIFYFFNRYRQYNEKEGVWLGWERKRGKLMEFSALVRGDKSTSYNVLSGDVSNLFEVKYVITLDADTQLPRDAAKKLIGAMAHVLNKPYLDFTQKKVIRGHGLMQPRVSVGILSGNKTLFSKLFSGETGIDIYTRAVSDIYEDLFDEGIFTGKGIYDIDVFNNVLKDVIPENSILSHDLLEGSYLRTALLTDVELIDGYPAYYNSNSKRLHRWVRGDWQLLPWLFKKTSLNKLSMWKIFDNLRRSLLSPSIIVLIIIVLLLFPNPNNWLFVAFISLLCPIFLGMSDTVVSPVKGIGLSYMVVNGKNTIEQFFLIFCFLTYQVYLMLDAIIRTLYRLMVSKKNLLQWQTAADAEAFSGKTLKDYIKDMWAGSILSALISIIAFRNSIETGFLLLPSCIIWFLSPCIAHIISKDIKPTKEELTKEQENILRRISRKTWAYFEDFVNWENNYLAPDNYQEDPHNGVASRTSPTNMGMGITSNLVALDLGYIGVLEFTNRLDKIISSMESLEKYNGHFYNWYDTKNKNPLTPKYISTVDSGNLVGYLWIAIQALDELLYRPIFSKVLKTGLEDTLKLANEELESLHLEYNYHNEIIKKIKDEKFDVICWKNVLLGLWSKALEIEKIEDDKSLYWNDKVKTNIRNQLKETQKFFPWIDIIANKKEEMANSIGRFRDMISIVPLVNLSEEIDTLIEQLSNSLEETNGCEWKDQVKQLLLNSKKEITNVINKVEELKKRLSYIADNTDFKMLYSKKRQLFSIGYDVEGDSLGKSYYDLLASESRQASFVAIAKGDVEQSHWFKLGRAMTLISNNKTLVSWTGTMFEYLMPLIIMQNYPNTLLDETYKTVVESQKKYCRQRKVPWGISESAFYYFDVSLNYQYKAFGMPGLGLKRGLINELVISPYSTIMALQVDLNGAISNINNLKELGMEGRYGLYESIDYTRERLPIGKKHSVVKCFMVHHEGMSLMALDNVLSNNILQKRFHRIPRVKAAELLLQEKIPKAVIYDREQQYVTSDVISEKQYLATRRYFNAKTETPETNLMSNGNYSLMITNSGSGYGKKGNMTVYRWREDATVDDTGMFFYIKNLNSNEYWSATYEPCKYEGEEYKAIFSLDKVEFKRKDGNLKTHTEITVSTEDNSEVRRISITNNSEYERDIEITSYCEVTLAPYNADLVHPTFGNLFIKTEYVDELGCIIANRRPRAKGQKRPWIMQTIAVKGNIIGSIQYETNRDNFIGRGRSLINPQVLDNDAQLKMTVGAVLDPIISMRIRVRIEKGETCIIGYTTAVADSREEIMELAKKYRDINNINRTFELSLAGIQDEIEYLGIKPAEANIYQMISSKIIFLNTLLKSRAKYIMNIRKGQSALWAYGISGDLPIVLLVIKDERDKDLVKQILNGHEYWSIKGLKVDLVILNMQGNSYMQSIQDVTRNLINSSHARDKQNKPGGVFLYNKSTMAEDDIDLLRAIARIVIYSEKGTLLAQIKEDKNSEAEKKQLEMLHKEKKEYSFQQSSKISVPQLNYFNGLGGFDKSNNSYVILLNNYKNTPEPWINVISNDNFGFHVSESGVSYTWNKNSRENKLTTWSNDPVIDGEAEEIYIRDELTGDLWSISPKPIRDKGEYIIEHGFGYSTFKHEAYGIIGEMTMFVDMNENVKICKAKLKNSSNEQRQLSVSYYAKVVLGVTHEQTSQYIFTGFDDENEYIYARNPYSESFGKLLCYMKIFGGKELSFTGDRKEFIGRNGSVEEPKGLNLKNLPNTVGAGFDPCLAESVKLVLKTGEEKELLILFGEEESFKDIAKIINKYGLLNKVDEELNNTKNYWKKMLNTIQVETPDKSMDLMINGWLMYQVISCRLWSRTGFYQSGGAYGFRDQLQDVMAVSYINPEITRKHIIYSASKQYLQGDVQHWWHPVVESGIRTRFSDDLLWLPYVTADYIKNTGDFSILEEEAGYLDDEELKEGEDERYNISKVFNKKGTIYEHCIKAIEKSLKFGSHNIPLMGSGDWNDGMSTIGNQGDGESVWLGWFLYSILDKFVYICSIKDDKEKLKRYSDMKEFIKENLEKNAWDGGWYRRAYFDDGTPLGSIQNDECQIDSISQSWAVISGAAKESRAKEAMEAVQRNLINEDKGIVMLLNPAFDKSSLEPGYIKGYVPGVRENGGQYTHASIWVILAMAKMRYNNKAWQIFNMINPINHAKSYLSSKVYKVEPYVMTADVYAVEPHTGRGGWSWYTGAAGWMYRAGIESILGLKFNGKDGFTIKPCVPNEWKEYKIYYTKDKCKYNIVVNRGEEEGIWLDGNKMVNGIIPFLKEGEHKVSVVINR